MYGVRGALAVLAVLTVVAYAEKVLLYYLFLTDLLII